MIELNEYLDVSHRTAVAEWQSILQRVQLPVGKNQVNYTPVETLLCFGLGLIGTRTKSGEINISPNHPVVQTLAKLVKRSPDSLTLKLLNLNGGRVNTAKFERALWAELTNDIPRFENLYEVIIRAGRSVGLENDVLPDFLEIETHTLQSFLDADRVTRDELRDSVDIDLQDWQATHPGDDPAETERVLIGTARIGQKQFARRVLENYGHTCVFCGLGFRSNGLPASRMLIASHIKPWRDSENKERVDSNNGLAACPTHDAAFDTFLITIAPDLSIVRSPMLRDAILVDPVVARNFGPDGMFSRLAIIKPTDPPAASYIRWHARRFVERASSKNALEKM